MNIWFIFLHWNVTGQLHCFRHLKPWRCDNSSEGGKKYYHIIMVESWMLCDLIFLINKWLLSWGQFMNCCLRSKYYLVWRASNKVKRHVWIALWPVSRNVFCHVGEWKLFVAPLFCMSYIISINFATNFCCHINLQFSESVLLYLKHKSVA